MTTVKTTQKLELRVLPGLADRAGRFQVRERLGTTIKPRPLVAGRHEPRTPVSRTAGHLRTGKIVHDDKAGQIRILRTQPIAHPASQRGTAGQRRARVHLADAPDVVESVGPARTDS